ncbi:alcohol acetyltransferase-domain-containing protein [Infundibulicybe gibba]|nr:alcohol acetyltransferase-domain-containing protein [Infundibulicybe gibba]
MTSGSGSTLRPAGLLERFHITRQLLGFDSCVICAAKYSSKLRLSPPILYPALGNVIHAHGALGVRLRLGHAEGPAFVRLGQVDLDRAVHYISEDIALETVLEAQFEEQFDTASDQPLWRLIVLPDNTVVFAYHHGIGDGMSGISFHKALLSALSTLTATPNHPPAHLISVPASAELSPAIENVTRLSPSWGRIFWEVCGLFTPTSWSRGSSAWTGRSIPHNFTSKTNVKLIYFEPEAVAEFIGICRRHHATLTSAFFTLSHSVLSRIILPSESKTISSYIPISLRGIVGTSPDVFCDHVTGYHFYPPIQPDFSWADASGLASELRSQIRILPQGKARDEETGGLECSNLGRVDLGNDMTRGDWSITRVIFAPCSVVVGSALKVNMAGDPLGGLTVSVTWSDDAVERSLVESFVVQLQDRFNVVIENDNN